jgi:phosphoglucosamine mutase
MKRLFGTDGIRSVAGEYPLDPPTVRKFGAALAATLAADGDRQCRVIFGMDTRESGGWLRDEVAAGLFSGGTEAVDCGVISTPGLAFLIRKSGFDAGVMISASHNPFQDNGLKVFNNNGLKLSDAQEKQVEDLMLDGEITDPGSQTVPVRKDGMLLRHYMDHLKSVLAYPERLNGLHLLLDCANGSASAIAPEIFRHYGAEVTSIGDAPDGRNINLGCGSTHLELLAQRVVDSGADLGLAFDGDADRCLAIDRQGRILDGDHILYIAGRNLNRRGDLRGNAVVATIMSNFWLEERLREEGIDVYRTPVGDKYVLERMVADGFVLGGEQSGHMIFLQHGSAGDGILTGLLLLDLLRDEEHPLERIIDGIEPYPQLLINVRVKQKPNLLLHPEIGPVAAEVEAALEGIGRLVMRYSGTESLARVMIEGKDAKLVSGLAERMAGVIRSAIGE